MGVRVEEDLATVGQLLGEYVQCADDDEQVRDELAVGVREGLLLGASEFERFWRVGSQPLSGADHDHSDLAHCTLRGVLAKVDDAKHGPVWKPVKLAR